MIAEHPLQPQPVKFFSSSQTNFFTMLIARHSTRAAKGLSEEICALRFAHYNFCRIHQSLRVTPAMAAGIVNRCLAFNEASSLGICLCTAVNND